MTNLTKKHIEETLASLCTTLGLDQRSAEPRNQRKIFSLYDALLWIAQDVEKQLNPEPIKSPRESQSAKKFLALYPMAQIWPPSTGGDVYRIVRFVGDTDYITGVTEEAAWQNAAESLPAQPENPRLTAFREYRNSKPEPVAPVEAQESLRGDLCWFGNGECKEVQTYRSFYCKHHEPLSLSEPKTTTSKMSTYAGVDILGNPIFEPPPDSSSISTEPKPMECCESEDLLDYTRAYPKEVVDELQQWRKWAKGQK